MKYILFTFMVVCTAVYPSAEVRSSKRYVRPNINSAANKVLKLVSKYMQVHGLDSHPISNPQLKVDYRKQMVKYHGVLDLTQGKIRGLSQMKRNGDVFKTTHKNKVLVKFPIRFDEICFRYHYVLHILGVAPAGEVYGKITDLILHVSIEVDTKTFRINLLKFNVVDVGGNSMSFTGSVMWNWFNTVMFDNIHTFMNEEIKRVFSKFVKEKIKAYISNINNYTAKHRKEAKNFVKKHFKGIIP